MPQSPTDIDEIKSRDLLILDLSTKITSLLESKDFRVAVKFGNHPNGAPTKICGYVPDIFAIKYINKTTYRFLIDFESHTTLSTEPNLERWRRFSNLTNIDVGTKTKFIIIIPDTCMDYMHDRTLGFHLNLEILTDNQFKKKLEDLEI